jgi:hypothetical protein
MGLRPKVVSANNEKNTDKSAKPLESEKVAAGTVRKALGLPRGATHGDAIALAQARQAIKGKTEAAREIREAIEGKTAQRDTRDEELNRIRVVVIDSENRPNWSEMRRRTAPIDVPGLPRPQ